MSRTETGKNYLITLYYCLSEHQWLGYHNIAELLLTLAIGGYEKGWVAPPSLIQTQGHEVYAGNQLEF